MLRIVLFGAMFLSLKAWSAEIKYVKIDQGHEVYTEYTASRPGASTVVLVNGLVYDLARWDEYLAPLLANGTGVLKYNFRGQSKTLLRELEQNPSPRFFETGIQYGDLAQELTQVLNALEIKEKVTVVGLSYGASIAAEFANQHPERVENLILMAPLVVSLDKYNPAGAWIRWSLDAIRLWWGPIWGPWAYDYYYNMIFHSYLLNRLTNSQTPEEMKDHEYAYKESIFHLVRAVRDFDLKKYTFKDLPNVHLMVAADEDSLLFNDQLQAWEAWDKGTRGSLVLIESAAHAIPDTAPIIAARLTSQILQGEKTLGQGRLFRAKEEGLHECKNTTALKAGTCD